MTTTIHPLSEADRATMAAIRAFLGSMPAMAMTPDSRPAYDEMIRQTPPAEAVQYAPGEVGGIRGWWCRVENAPEHAVVLYLHGGGYVLGSAEAYRHVVGQIAAQAGVDAFVPDDSLAPERPFPGALDDAVVVYDALVAQCRTRIALVGDSAGGGLTLALLDAVEGRPVPPVAAVAVSPWTDLSLSGSSFTSRAAADPLLDRARLAKAAAAYLAGADPSDPGASPLFGRLARRTPVLIHVGDDEVLLDDSLRYAEGVEQAGGDVEVHVWQGMQHVFSASVAELDAARLATARMGQFLAEYLQSGVTR